MSLLSHQGLMMAGSSGPTDYPSTVLADSPRGWWRLNETITNGATMVDSSGNGRNGNYTVPSADLSLQPGHALVAGSTKSYAKSGTANAGGRVVAFPAITASYSVEAWFECLGTQTLQQIFAIDQGNRLFQLRINGGKIEFINIRGTVVTLASAGSVYNNGRHHVIGTVDSTTGTNNINLYLDGSLIATGSGTSTGSVSNDATIGCYQTPTSNPDYQFTGNLADVAIYAVALSSIQVAAHWNAGK